MCTNDESFHVIDTKMYLFHIECHVRVVVTDLVVQYGNTNNKPRCFGDRVMKVVSLDDTKRGCSYCQGEAGGRWGPVGLPPERYFRGNPFWDMGERCSYR